MKIATGKKLEILRQLSDHGESYGYEMVKRAGSTLKLNAIYVSLRQLVADGLISGRVVPGEKSSGLPRRRYVLQAAGRRAVRATAAAQVAWDAPLKALGIEVAP